jgi:DNA-directed RNA polymerase specialized sigma24 family protein
MAVLDDTNAAGGADPRAADVDVGAGGDGDGDGNGDGIGNVGGVGKVDGVRKVDARNAARSTEDDFREFVTARWSALLRTAYLLTGDRDRAEDLVQSALVRTHRHWSVIQRGGASEAYVRKTMVNLNTDWWRRLGSRERRVESVPDNRLTVDAYTNFELRDELWAALQQLPARMRAVARPALLRGSQRGRHGVRPGLLPRHGQESVLARPRLSLGSAS